MPKCCCCKRELPKSAFAPSYLASSYYRCRNCCHDYYIKYKENGRRSKVLKLYRIRKKIEKEKSVEKSLNEICGGLKCFVLNKPNSEKGEFKYTVFNTGKAGLATNDKTEFLNYLYREA